MSAQPPDGPLSAPSQAAIPPNRFADDDGSAEGELAATLHGYAQGTASGVDVLAALTSSRLLVPVVAVLETVTDSPSDGGHVVEKDSSMATVTMRREDGSQALLAFTSTDAMQRWQADARPVAVGARQAAQAALAEGAVAMFVDVAGPQPFVLEGVELRTLALADDVQRPLHDDASIARAIRTALGAEMGVVAVLTAPGVERPSQQLRVTLVVDPTIGPAEFRALVPRVSQALATNLVLRSRVTAGLQLSVVAPGHEPDGAVTVFRRA